LLLLDRYCCRRDYYLKFFDVEPFKTVVLLGKSNICPYTLADENDFEDANTNRKCNSLRRNTSKAGRNESFFPTS
jgi:hypothetical protein